jgi:ABC-2 type transport system permease protein
MKWLLRRELWENKGMFFWSPLVLGSVMILLMGGALLSGKGPQSKGGMHLAEAAASISDVQRLALVKMAVNGYFMLSAPILIMFSVIVFFYCLAALHEERHDRSILFWKSLPISDHLTVFSKVAMAIIVAPVISIVIASVTALTVLLAVCVSLSLKGVPVFDLVLTEPALYLSPLKMLGMLPVYFLWALPTAGWLLLVSSWARSKVFLWAVGLPLMLTLIVKWADFVLGMGWDIGWFFRHVIVRGLGGVLPGAWLMFESYTPVQLMAASSNTIDISAVFTQAWSTLGGASVWYGAAAGAAMIAGAIRMRRWRGE